MASSDSYEIPDEYQWTYSPSLQREMQDFFDRYGLNAPKITGKLLAQPGHRYPTDTKNTKGIENAKLTEDDILDRLMEQVKFIERNEDIKPKFEPADVTIKLGNSPRTWKAHKEVVSSYSNFFRCAFGGHFREALSHSITLKEVSEKGVDFAINYMYHGWEIARTKTFRVTDDVYLDNMLIADILILADYLDMPTLMWAAHEKLMWRVLDLVMLARSDIQFGHKLTVRKNKFVPVAKELIQSNCIIGRDLGTDILELLKKLQNVNSFTVAKDAFLAVFPHSTWMMVMEIDW
ncbi:hypothetical protein GGR53DRAFT_527491 [Hypoxylon sp. FL1150]|nr:hypothetical protein GGR53DRAFT_527491 [Hypoxylon sp. FL1150]